MSFPGIVSALNENAGFGIVLGIVFLAAGVCFKLAAVPFHMWTPDVYEGSPTPVTAFFASAPKMAAVAMTVRVFIGAMPDVTAIWQQIFIFVSVVSMALGSFAAIGQTSIKRLKDMEAAKEAGATDTMSKKEALMFEREMDKLQKSIGGIKDMGGIPDAIFVVDVGYHKIAVTEAAKLGIPVIGVVDTNHSPEGIDYVIPGNDDSSKAVALYVRGVADAILEGRANAVQEVVEAARGGDDFVEVQEG